MSRHPERATPLFLLLLLPVLLAACGRGPGTVEGRVLAAGGEAVPRLVAAVYKLRTIDEMGQGGLYQKGSLVQEQSTGPLGRFSFVLEPGNYIVEVRQDDVEVGSRMVEIRSNRTVTVEFQLPGSSRGAVYMAKMFSRGVSAWI
jgi:hypothetical protein